MTPALGVSADGPVAPVKPAFAPTAQPGRSRDAGDTVVHLSEEARAFLSDRRGDSSTDLAAEVGTRIGAQADLDLTVPVWSRAGTEDPGDEAVSNEAQGAPDASASADADPGVSKQDGHPTTQKAPSPEQQRQIEQLRERDTEVRAHEAAHAAAAGALGGRPALEYTTGPDGRRYAVAGEVSIDTSPGRTPEETIARARTIRAAATAPADPSSQDLAVASDAARMEADARAAIQARREAERQSRADSVKTDGVDKAGASTTPDGPNKLEDGRSPSGALERADSLEHSDPDFLLLTLSSEQASSRGGISHSHLAEDCGFCRRAASTYA